MFTYKIYKNDLIITIEINENLRNYLYSLSIIL